MSDDFWQERLKLWVIEGKRLGQSRKWTAVRKADGGVVAYLYVDGELCISGSSKPSLGPAIEDSLLRFAE